MKVCAYIFILNYKKQTTIKCILAHFQDHYRKTNQFSEKIVQNISPFQVSIFHFVVFVSREKHIRKIFYNPTRCLGRPENNVKLKSISI